MKNQTTIKLTIAVFVAIAASLILLHHFRRKRKKNRRALSLEKQIKSVERLQPKKGRIQIARRTTSSKHASQTKKSIDSKKKYTTSSETFGDSSTKQSKAREPVGVTKSFKATSPIGVVTDISSISKDMSSVSKDISSISKDMPSVSKDISSVSKEIKDSSPSSYVEKSEDTIMPSSAEKDRSQYSSESYPLAITWKRKELGKSGESVGKLLKAEEAASPTEAIPIDSYCYCGRDVTISPSMTGELNESCKVQLLPTIVKPVSFDPYSPEDFTQVEGASDEMSKNSMQMTVKPKNHRIIVPFLPILHAITYASKHGELLQELLQNYEYYESQFT